LSEDVTSLEKFKSKFKLGDWGAHHAFLPLSGNAAIGKTLASHFPIHSMPPDGIAFPCLQCETALNHGMR